MKITNKKSMRIGNKTKIVSNLFSCAVGFLVVLTTPARACTIFVLTDTNRTLFCNNEDWSNPNTRIWFVPARWGDHGYAAVGFDDGWSQGGVNTMGLAYDVVAGFKEEWKADRKLLPARGHSPLRMLATCATVEEAIAFYRQRQEPGFSRCKMLVADKTGASAIIGFHDGKFQSERSTQCRGFGYGGQTLGKMLAENSEPTPGNGASILRACRQTGQYATKYSNVFDLQSGQIFLYPFPDRNDGIKLDLKTELKKGAHYYDMVKTREQIKQPLRPLPANIKR